MTEPEHDQPTTTEPSSSPPPDVNPAPTAADAYPDHMIQGFVGSGSPVESNVHYRSRDFALDDEG
ncbi:MAG: hypothetical protein ACK5LS_11595 [Propioniciclava sp.]